MTINSSHSASMIAPCDRLGRRRRLSPRSTGKRISPQPRDLLWFRKLREHGPLPSSFLLAFAHDMGKSAKRAQERLTDLFHEANTPDGEPYLVRPPQQFRTLDSRYNQLVYDLSPAGYCALERTDGADRTRVAPSGPWLHRLMTSCITASIELATRARDDLSYIPQADILTRAGTELRCSITIADPVTKRSITADLIPDAIFGLAYHTPDGDRFRFFAVEADRATEPAASPNWNRKSFMRNLLQYEAYVAGGAYREHLALTAPLLVLTVSSDQRRAERMIELAASRYPRGCAFILLQTWEDFGPIFRPPQPNMRLVNDHWLRSGLPGFVIGQP